MNLSKLKTRIISLMICVMVCVSVFPAAGAAKFPFFGINKEETTVTETTTQEETTSEENVTEETITSSEKTTKKTENKKPATTKAPKVEITTKKGVYTERDKIIDYALSEVGYTQQNGYNKFSAEFGSGYMPWCNYFVVWCAKQAGISPRKITGTSSYWGNCEIYMRGLMKQGRFFPNDGSYTPQKGDLVFYNSARNTSNSTHIGFVLSANSSTVTTVEGNTSVKGTRGVGKKVRPRYSYIGDMVIIGFGVPAYDNEEIPKVKIKKTAQAAPAAAVKKVNAGKLIDVRKFETNATAQERLYFIESAKMNVPKTQEVCKNIDFISVINISYKPVDNTPCDCDVCICK